MLDVTLNEIIKVLGGPTRTSGHQYYFQCPVCASSGGDTHCDNLLFNDRKGVLKCFACDEGGKEVLKMINAHRSSYDYKTQSMPPIKPKKIWWKENCENLYQYMYEANVEMPNYIKKWLFEHYGITNQTIEDCSIGFDNAPTMVKIGPSIVFPMFSLKHNEALVGFELREVGTQKIIRHTLDAPSSLCTIYGRRNAEYLIVCEGFKDAYCMKQLIERTSSDIGNYMICIPAHGCKDILKNLTDINMSQFKRHFLVLDNDQAGDDATHLILQQYPFFIDKRKVLKGYNDVCDYWRSICYN